MKQIDNIDDLIAKYLSGNASPEEALLLQSWKTQSSENLKLFEASRKTHEALKNSKSKKKIDENAAWEILNNSSAFCSFPITTLVSSTQIKLYF